MKRTDEWEKFIGLVDNFIYGDNGVFVAALDNENMDTYTLDTQEVVTILNMYKGIIESQGSLTEEQKKELDSYKKAFLEIDNGNNKIVNIYNTIKDIYEDIEEYID